MSILGIRIQILICFLNLKTLLALQDKSQLLGFKPSVFCSCLAAASSQQASTAVARLGRKGLMFRESSIHGPNLNFPDFMRLKTTRVSILNWTMNKGRRFKLVSINASQKYSVNEAISRHNERNSVWVKEEEKEKNCKKKWKRYF